MLMTIKKLIDQLFYFAEEEPAAMQTSTGSHTRPGAASCVVLGMAFLLSQSCGSASCRGPGRQALLLATFNYVIILTQLCLLVSLCTFV